MRTNRSRRAGSPHGSYPGNADVPHRKRAHRPHATHLGRFVPEAPAERAGGEEPLGNRAELILPPVRRHGGI